MIDFVRFTVALVVLSALDLAGYAAFGWDVNYTKNLVLSSMIAVIWAVRDQEA